MKRLTICIDFDGVIHDSSHPLPHRRMGPPMDGASVGISRLRRAGHTVVVCTARPRVEHVIDWLNYYGFGFEDYQVTNGKPQADVYVDDKALRHEDWNTTLAVLQGRAGRLGMTETLRS